MAEGKRDNTVDLNPHSRSFVDRDAFGWKNRIQEMERSRLPTQLKEIWQLGTDTYNPRGFLYFMFQRSSRFNNRRPLAMILYGKADRALVIGALASDYLGGPGF